MDYYILKGLIVVFLIQHCRSEGVPSSIQSSSAVNLQDAQALTQEQEPAPAEVVPVVAPPSLQEVQQAVQEASEQVEGRGAEEVLKGLLERVVEAALGQVEGAGEAKVDDTAVIFEGAGTGEADSETGELEEGEVDVGDGAGEEQEVAALEDESVAVEGKGETIIEGGHGKETEINQEVVETLENVENNKEQGQTSEMQSQEDRKTPAAAEMAVGGEPEQETMLGSDLSPGVADVEQVGDEWEKLEPVGEGTDEVIVLPSDTYETAQTVEGESIEQVMDTNTLKDNELLQTADIEGNLVVHDVDSEQIEAVGVEAEEAADGETVIEGGSIEKKVADGSEAREEEQITLEAANGSKNEDQVLQISDGAPHEGGGGHGTARIEQSPEQHPEQHPEAPPPSPSLSGAEMGGNTLGEEKSDHGNEISAPIDDILPHDPEQAKPTLDNFVKDVLVLPPQVEGEQLGEANELVEDTETRETSELGLEAWKIGAICAAVLLVLETVVIIIYILRNRNKNSSGRQRACEEGCVEPEAATGGDYSDDTLPAGNGDTLQTAILDPSNVASTLTQNKEQQEVEQVIPMSEFLPSSAEDSTNNKAEPDPSPDLRTSTL